jgi:hypothetical protein
MIQDDDSAEIRSNLSGSPTMVVAQNASETGIAHDIRRFGWAGSVREWNGPNGSVLRSLMRARMPTMLTNPVSFAVGPT